MGITPKEKELKKFYQEQRVPYIIMIFMLLILMSVMKEQFIGLPIAILILLPAMGIIVFPLIKSPRVINWIMYLKNRGDIIKTSIILRSFLWLYIVTLPVLVVFILQEYQIRFTDISSLLNPIMVKTAEETWGAPQAIILFVLIFSAIKWYWFLFKTPRMKEKLIGSSPFISKKIPIPKFIIFVFIMYGLSGTITTTISTPSGGIVALLGWSMLWFVNIIRFMLVRFVPQSWHIDENTLQWLLGKCEILLNVFVVGLVAFCLLSLVVYLVISLISFFKNTSYENKELQNDGKVFFKLYAFRHYGEWIRSLSQAYDDNRLNDYAPYLLEKSYSQKNLSAFEEYKEQFDTNIPRDTIVWLDEVGIDFLPKFRDLLFMIGFSLVNLLYKLGLPLIVIWLLAQRIEFPLFLIFLVCTEHFVFVDVQTWYYMRYYYRNKLKIDNL